VNRPQHSISLSLIIALLFGFLHGAQAETPTTIHIGVPTNSATWFPLYVAWKRGIFRDQGLDLLPVTMQARTALAALASKQIGFNPNWFTDDGYCTWSASQSDHGAL
jgi:ABC-type nitrate/sulfonate/bicarbonate transport system substrate-binding protein